MIALLAFLSLLVAAPDLTKEEVKRLVAAGISDGVIVEYIHKNGPVQPLTSQDLIDLRQANVSEEVLAAMLEPARAPATAPSETQDYASGGTTYYPYASYPWYYPSAYFSFGYYPYYYSYPYYHYHYPYYYPYRYAYPYSVHNYRNHTVPHMSAPAPQHPSNMYRGHH